MKEADHLYEGQDLGNYLIRTLRNNAIAHLRFCAVAKII